MVSEQKSEVEETGALRADPTGQNSLRSHLRFISVTQDRQLLAGELFFKHFLKFQLYAANVKRICEASDADCWRFQIMEVITNGINRLQLFTCGETHLQIRLNTD